MPSKRRARGEGSITHSGDRWIARLRVGGREWQRTCATQADALRALTAMKRDAALGVPASRYTLNDALDDFLRHGEASRGWAPATRREYRSALDRHVRPLLGRRPLLELSVRDVQRLIDGMLAGGHSGRHVAHVRGVLRAALTHSMRQELIHRNVAALAASPPVRRPEMQALSGAELRRLFAALEGERLRPLVIVGATLGLRRGELIALRNADVDLDAATLSVRRTGTHMKLSADAERGEYVEGPPKSARSQRTLSLPPALVTLLRTQRASVAEERLRLGKAWQDEDRVFPGESGGPVSAHAISLALGRALTRASLPHIRVHDLRHSAASGLLAAGGSLRDVQEMLGHSSYALTADVYAHILDDQRKATADRIEQALGSAIGGA